MLTIKIENLHRAGCNNGNYPQYEIWENGKLVYSGFTCRCENGCSGTDSITALYAVPNAKWEVLSK